MVSSDEGSLPGSIPLLLFVSSHVESRELFLMPFTEETILALLYILGTLVKDQLVVYA